jgi:hypothetical protein
VLPYDSPRSSRGLACRLCKRDRVPIALHSIDSKRTLVPISGATRESSHISAECAIERLCVAGPAHLGSQLPQNVQPPGACVNLPARVPDGHRAPRERAAMFRNWTRLCRPCSADDLVCD